MKRDVCGVYTALEERAKLETSHWDFNAWYQDGVDCYLAREVIYLCLEWNEPEKTGISFDKYTDYQIALMAWEYNQEMDDFTRFWNSDETKLEVLKECKLWIQNAYPQVEGWFGRDDNGDNGNDDE